MSQRTRAIALCRVSSTEQLENNSLNRQRDAVLKAAEHLDVDIPENYWWSGSVSSKRGTNLGRKDLKEAIELSKKDKRIKYVIVDEPDRFMRSIDEAAFYEVTFRQLGVTVYYASDPELNKGDLASKLLKFTKYLSAEGSNEERQRKSISGQTKALMEGRFPFPPKPGYKRGYERAIQEVHAVQGPILRDLLVRVASRQITPTQGLAELNKSDFIVGRSLYKMDKFRKILTDPFYAGIVEIDKQVKFRNENGLHEPLITKDQHLELVRIMSSKKKSQSGPRKNGNPDYPLSNLINCDDCRDRKNGRLVGFDHGNGKPGSTRVYHKYRCRACKKYLQRQELNSQIEQLFEKHPMPDAGRKDLIRALNDVWKEKEGQKEQEVSRIQNKVSVIKSMIDDQVEAVTNPKNDSIRDEIMASIAKKKELITLLEDELSELSIRAKDDKEQFLSFAFDFIDKMGSKFLDTEIVSKENRLRCKEMIFPAGFWIDSNKKVYTPEVSILYRLAAKKKDSEESKNSLMVRVRGL